MYPQSPNSFFYQLKNTILSLTKKRSLLNPALFLLLTGLFIVWGLWTTSDLAAQTSPVLQITKIVEGYRTKVTSGTEFTYLLSYNCASILQDCEGATIVDSLPPELEFISLTSNPKHVQNATYNSGTHKVTFTFVDPLPAGSTGILKISTQFSPGELPNTTASNQATFDATNADSVTTNPVEIKVSGDFSSGPVEMTTSKILNGPPVIGFPITFTLQLCSPDTVGGINLMSPVFTDTLPSNATFVTAQGTEGVDWVYDSGLPQTVAFINLPDAIVSNSCLERTVTLIYDSDPSGLETNTFSASGTPEACDGSTVPLPTHCNGVTGEIGIGSGGSSNYTPIDPFADVSASKSSVSASTFSGQSGEISGSATTTALQGEAVTYTVSAQNTGYITLTNAIITDTIPSEFLLTGWNLSPAEDTEISGFYELASAPGVWQALPSNPYNASTTINVASLGLGGDTITAIRWDLGTLPPLTANWSTNVYGTVDPMQPFDTNFQNCSRFTADSTDGVQVVDSCNTVDVIKARSIPRIQKTNDAGPYVPGQEVNFSLVLRNDTTAHLDYHDPILSDLLPPVFELITNTIVMTAPVGAPTPAPTILYDYDGTPDQTLLVWKWEGADSYSLPPGEQILVQFKARIIEFTPPGTYFNTASITSNGTNPDVHDCTGHPTEFIDVNDMDQDGDTAETICINPNNNGFVDVAVALSMESEKFVRGARDDHFQKLGLTFPGGEMDWKVVITNVSNVTTTNIIIYDILPYIGDTGVVAIKEDRDTQWRPNMMGPVEVSGAIPLTIFYSQSTNPCRPELKEIDGCENDWTTIFPDDDPTSVQALKLDFCDGGNCLVLDIGSSVEFSWPMVAPNDAPTHASCEPDNLDPNDPPYHQIWAADNPDCEIAWNSFGFSAEGGGLTLLPAEPIRVGIATAEQPVTGFSLGNFVWLDVAGVENDNIQQAAEQDLWGVNGVRVELRHPDGSMVDLNGDGFVDFRYTGPHFDARPGYYLFGNLPADDYVVRFFPPAGYTTSSPNIGGDDALDSDGESSGVDPTYGAYLQTATITLASDDFTWDQGLWQAADYGDLPWDGVNFTYPITTTGAISPELAARHIIVPNLYLGNSVDAELDGQPSVLTDGDDNNGVPDDEDGILFTTPIIAGEQACLEVTAVTTQTQAANLSAWFDFDGDGTLSGPTEQVFADVQPDSGTDLGSNVYEHCFTVPATTGHGGTLYSRFRLSTDDGLTPEGTANDGEVEDYHLELVTVGNYVWFDAPLSPGVYNNIQDGADTAAANVPVNLIWGGPDGLIGTSSDNVTYSSSTDVSGEYHFSGLLLDPTGDGPDEFQIELPQKPGIPALANQGGDDALDSDGTGTGPVLGPIFTHTLPIGTNDNAPNDTPGYKSYPDNRDDLSFDFGFVEAVAIGNIIWRDDGAGPGEPNNGYLSGSEVGINSVTVELYNSGDTPGSDAPVATTTTASGGLYQFDYLFPGQYFVHIPASQFDIAGVLREYISSTGSGNDETSDHATDENGIDDANWRTNGISTLVYDLQPNTEITGESQSNYAGYLDDDNVNFTADFGFHRPVAIGNIVWIDDGSGGGIINNGIMDGGEAGVANVTVELYADGDMPGSDAPAATTITDLNGYYVFDTLTRGRYFVHIPAAEFSGGDLVGYLSSAGTGNNETTDETGDENGIDDIAMLTNGISSLDYNLKPNNETTSDNETSYSGPWDDNNVNFTADFGFVEAVAIGNIVWNDNGASTANNGVQDAGELGITDVTVELYAVGDDPGSDTPIATDVTDANGRYEFDRLHPGQYFIHIPSSEFSSGGDLEDYASSTGNGSDETSDQDIDENGINNADPTTNGISSTAYDLQPNSETTADDQTGYGGTLDDDNVNFTADFGFYQAVAIGNIVWNDNGIGSGGISNNGIMDGGELGVDGVTIQLYDSGDALISSTITSGGGFYEFDNIVPGQYYVHIPASEFGVSQELEDFLSSTDPIPAVTDETADQDVDENGIDDPSRTTNGISSLTYTLTAGTMVTGEGQSNYSGYLSDSHVNFTADFGFYQLVAIGNIIWNDNGAGGGTINNGIMDGGELGIGGITVQLYADGAIPGITTPITTTTTGGSGFYLFDNLTPGQYFVHIPATEFNGAGDLVGFASSTGNGTDESSNQEVDENGIDDPDRITNGISSPTYTLQPNSEVTGEDGGFYMGSLGDDDVNLTADFGFYEAVAIGNIVWNDNGSGGGIINNGIMDGGEIGIDGVTVQLYDSGNTLISTTTTSGGGFYGFDNLVPGDYYVHVPASEFGAGQALEDFLSSTNNGTDESSDEDADENGIDNPNRITNGISTPTYTLSINSETTADDESSYDGSLDDDNVNFTADFGFYEAVAIGNIVWNDNGAGAGILNNGIKDGTELGIDNVTVQLYTNGATPGITTPISTTTTSGGGFYQFDALVPGLYFVHIPASEFGVGADLDNYVSSTSNGINETDDQNADENGIDDVDPVGNGISSIVYDLQPNSESSTDDETSYTGLLDNDNVNFTADFGFYEAVAIGNIVWLDNGDGSGTANNGIMDGTEAGIDNVTVRLYADGATVGVTSPISTTTTSSGGRYQFDNLPPGQYFIHIPASEFNTTEELVGFASSTGNGTDESINQDADENGIDDLNRVTNGISSPSYTLQPNSEVMGEDAGFYTGGLDDDNVNFTADFGFYEAVAIGNIVWNDNGAGGGGANNGIMDGTEVGIDNVTVQLYTDGDVAEVDAPIATTTTSGGGLYQFDNLIPGQYFVHIPSAEFDGGDLAAFVSSTGNGTDEVGDQDVDENGIDEDDLAANGISSPAYDLQPDGETAVEDESSYSGSLDDDNVNFTADFGFYQPVAIGNVVWHDNGAGGGTLGDGAKNGSEAGIDDVTVELYAVGDTPSSSTPISTTITAGGGFYAFDMLPPGNYFVHIPASEFMVGGDLEDHVSSTGNGVNETSDQNADENGIDDANPASNGINSSPYDLQPGSETTVDDETSYGGSLDNDSVNFTADFSFVALAGIGDIVWLDTNEDGIQDIGEVGIVGITVNLYNSGNALISTTTTITGGLYSFIDLQPGDYYVEFVVPSGYIVSPQNSGIDPAVDSDADLITGRTIPTTLDAGEYDPTWDAGLYVANPDITTEKTVSVARTAPGQTAVLTYTISVTNTGNVRLTNVNVTDTLPVGLTYVPSSASPSETTHAGQDLSWDDLTSGADFNPDDTLQIVFETTLTNTIGTYINEAGVIAIVPAGNNYPGGTVDDIDDIPVIVADPSVALDKEMVAPGIVDGVITYTIRITNTGPSMLDVLPLFDTFTGPMEYIGGTPTANTIDNVGGNLVWNDLTTTFGDLSPGQVITIETVFQITSISMDVTIMNSAQILGGIDLFSNLTNEPDDTVTLINIPTAVELTSFTVDRMEDMQVRVEWVTVSEIDNFGFRVYRNQTNVFAEATEIHFEPSAVPGGTGFGASYQYVDTIPAYGTYYYWLEDVETGGVTAVHGYVPLSDPVSLTVNQLYQLFMPFIINP